MRPTTTTTQRLRDLGLRLRALSSQAQQAYKQRGKPTTALIWAGAAITAIALVQFAVVPAWHVWRVHDNTQIVLSQKLDDMMVWQQQVLAAGLGSAEATTKTAQQITNQLIVATQDMLGDRATISNNTSAQQLEITINSVPGVALMRWLAHAEQSLNAEVLGLTLQRASSEQGLAWSGMVTISLAPGDAQRYLQ